MTVSDRSIFSRLRPTTKLPSSPAARSTPVRILLGAVLVLAFAGRAFADGLLVTIVAPPGPEDPGAAVTVELLAVNPGEAAVRFDPPSRLPARALADGRSWTVELEGVPGGGGAVPPGGFLERKYSVRLPLAATGRVVLEIAEGLRLPVLGVVMMREPNAAPAPGAPRPALPADQPVVSSLGGQTAVSQLSRSFADHFSALDPMYFIYGTKSPAAKFQFSLKYRLFAFGAGPDDTPASTVQFGYTQRSLWDASRSSSPFYDTSYLPSLFYQFLAPAPDPDSRGILTWLGAASGYQHESNGQAGELSRGMNTLYVRSGVMLGRPDQWHALVVARVFDYIWDLSGNPQIKDYRGYGDWGLTLADGGGVSLAYTGWSGQRGNHLTGQFDLNIPVKIKVLDFATYFLVQYFDGYGESLRAYEVRSDSVRAGISLIR